uniref:G-protein coupled receptors family 1 profile domain-containing protein n=1 Tax=Ditylenchus dipsaci TaxID=166011 RepID=A0A915EU08_9BILA
MSKDTAGGLMWNGLARSQLTSNFNTTGDKYAGWPEKEVRKPVEFYTELLDSMLDREISIWTDNILGSALDSLVCADLPILNYNPRELAYHIHVNAHFLAEKFDTQVWNVETNSFFYRTSLTKANQLKMQEFGMAGMIVLASYDRKIKNVLHSKSFLITLEPILQNDEDIYMKSLLEKHFNQVYITDVTTDAENLMQQYFEERKQTAPAMPNILRWVLFKAQIGVRQKQTFVAHLDILLFEIGYVLFQRPLLLLLNGAQAPIIATLETSAMEIYGLVHAPMVLILCVSGCIGHLLSIAVLFRMLNPTNVLLISMSGSQLALCVNFLYSTLYRTGMNCSVLVHMFSTFHVVTLSIIRHFSLKRLTNINSSLAWFTYQKCAKSLFFIYLSAILVCAPLYFQSEIVLGENPDSCPVVLNATNPRVHKIAAYRLKFSENALLQSINFWLFGSVSKLIPCSILCLMTYFILDSLRTIQTMAAKFGNVERDRQYHRTTKVILIVMVMFIVVEFPQGVLAVAQSVVVVPHLDILGDVFEMLTLLNSCLIFALFCSMNSRLRSAFIENSQRICYKRRCKKLLDVDDLQKSSNVNDKEHHLLKGDNYTERSENTRLTHI